MCFLSCPGFMGKEICTTKALSKSFSFTHIYIYFIIIFTDNIEKFHELAHGLSPHFCGSHFLILTFLIALG